MFEHLDVNSLLVNYGYWAVFIGCLLEGETILILGGLAAHQSSLRLVHVIVIATLGGMLGDQISLRHAFDWPIGNRCEPTVTDSFFPDQPAGRGGLGHVVRHGRLLGR
jgi:hypothetical protein